MEWCGIETFIEPQSFVGTVIVSRLSRSTSWMPRATIKSLRHSWPTQFITPWVKGEDFLSIIPTIGWRDFAYPLGKETHTNYMNEETISPHMSSWSNALTCRIGIVCGLVKIAHSIENTSAPKTRHWTRYMAPLPLANVTLFYFRMRSWNQPMWHATTAVWVPAAGIRFARGQKRDLYLTTSFWRWN
jgi:hypothetical protein